MPEQQEPAKAGQRPEAQSDIHEFEFMADAQRNKLAGLWAAELLGLIGHAAHDYAREHMHDTEVLLERLATDLKGRMTRSEIREKMRHLLDEAKHRLRRKS